MKNKTFSIYLYFPDYIFYEDLHLTLTDLLLSNLLNFLSIFIGLNVGKLFAFLFVLFKKFKLLKFLKFYKYLKLLVCSLGFAFHAYILLNNALNGDLIHFEELSKFKAIEMPNLIFCFKFDEREIDQNRKVSVNYLDELTNDLNLDFFRNFSFFDENYDQVDCNQFNRDKALERMGGVRWFYFIDLKCFEFSFLPIKNDRYLYLLKDVRFASVTFNKQVILNYYNSNSFKVYFMNKKRSTYELNGIDKLEFKANGKRSKQLISIDSDLVVFKQEDIFSYLRNRASLIFKTVNLNDTTEYNEELYRGSRKFNLKTKTIPTHVFGNDLEIDVS